MKNSKIGLLATEGTLKTKVYNKIFEKRYKLFFPNDKLQKQSVNKTIKDVKMGNVKRAAKNADKTARKIAIEYMDSW